MGKIELVEKLWLKKDIPEFNLGDTLRVYVKVVEGDKIRSQAFEGIVISKKGSGLRATFTVRRFSYGEGIERIFHIHSPNVEKIEVIKKTKAKRAKLYYLRRK
jgi:large subunit ribosomal protein L19